MDKVQDKLMKQFQNMDRVYEEYAKSKGLTYLSLSVLEDIYETQEGCTQKQISEDTHYPKQTVNLVVKSFLKEGYVILREMPENRKNKEIILTEEGKQFCETVVVPLKKKEEQAMTSLGTEERKELVRLLELYGQAYCAGIKDMI